MKKDVVIYALTRGAMHIQFDYKDKNGFVDFVEGQYSMYYGDNAEAHVENIDEVMAYPLFDGKSLNEISEVIAVA